MNNVMEVDINREDNKYRYKIHRMMMMSLRC